MHGPSLLLWTVAGALLLLAVALFVLPAATLSASYTHDLFVYLGGIHRIDRGQLPSRDFYSPLGLLGYALPYVGYRLVGQFGGAMEAASVLVLLAALPAAVVALANRVPQSVGVLILVAIFGLIVVPLNPGDGGGLVSQAMFYNRWCWAMLAVLFLFAIPPARHGRMANWLEPSAVAFLLSFLFFMKTSYFLVGFVFVVFFGILLKRFLRTGVIGIALFLPLLLAVQFTTGWVTHYLADVRTAIEITGPVRQHLLVQKVLFNSVEYALVAVAYLCMAPRKQLKAVDLLFAFYVVGASIPLLSQNTPQTYVFSLVALFAHLLALCQTSGKGDEAPLRRSRRMVTAALAVFLLPHLVRQCIATAFFLGGVAGHSQFTDIAPTHLPRMEGVYISASREGEYVRTLQSGVALLREQDVKDETMMALDFSNPFPALLNLPPALGEPWCLHVGRHINRETAMAGRQLFAGATYIMVPTYWQVRETRDFLLDVYGDYLATTYLPVAENEHWRLLRKASARNPAPAS